MENYLQLSPPVDLEFRRPFNTVVKQTLTVGNSHPTEPIAFKVKTTAPKSYCVRPNSGRIGPGSSQDVHVLLQAMREDPPLDFKCKDKFLVQAVKITNLESDDLQELWSRAENLKKVDPEAAKELICEKKLRCVFLPPLGGAVADSTPTHQLDSTPTATLEKADPRGARTASVGSKVDSVQDPDRDLREARETIKRLQAACEGYKSEIDRLNLLRQRRGAGTSGGDGGSAIDGGSNAGAMASKGINFQVALLMALIAFLLGAYLL